MDNVFTIQNLQAILTQIDAGKASGKSSAEILANAAVAFLELYVKETIAELQPAPIPPAKPLKR
jgi:hypothetical protein